MNIFKILASGHGKVSETNVSAFLSYLLNPKAEHGLRDELLKRVLDSLYQKNKEDDSLRFLVDADQDVRNLSIQSAFEFEVIPEQAFQLEGPNSNEQIVDVVILCFVKENRQNQSVAKTIISNNTKGELKQIFLIENKIKDSSTTNGQLLNQAKATLSTISNILSKEKDEIQRLLSLIFISPEGKKSTDEFLQFENDASINIKKVHLRWNSSVEDERTIVSFLREILEDDAQGNIEAIFEHTKHTIKSFINFVENDFKSAIEEKLESETGPKIYETVGDLGNDTDLKLNDTSISHFQDITNRLKEKYGNSIYVRHSKRHPTSVFLNGNKNRRFRFFSFVENEFNILLVFIDEAITNEDKSRLFNYVIQHGYSVKENNDSSAFIRSKTFSLDTVLHIFDMLYQLNTKTQ